MGIREYRPGYYPQRRDLSKLTEGMAKLYCIQVTSFQRDALGSGLNPCIAISRKIGVGAVEIANLVGEALSMKVLDRELMEQFMTAEQNPNYPHLMHERVPSLGEEVLMMLKGNKPFFER